MVKVSKVTIKNAGKEFSIKLLSSSRHFLVLKLFIQEVPFKPLLLARINFSF